MTLFAGHPGFFFWLQESATFFSCSSRVEDGDGSECFFSFGTVYIFFFSFLLTIYSTR